jgi:hypothetical protein
MYHLSDGRLAGLRRCIWRGFVFDLDFLAGGGSSGCRLVFGLSRFPSLLLLGFALVDRLAVNSRFLFLAWPFDFHRRSGNV